MISLDERYHDYLHTEKRFNIDGVNERVLGYGWNSEGNEIVGHYVNTENYKLYYDMNCHFVKKEILKSVK
tara:strand:- start:984 stop:1193 length:210 start_codon:yes stop_codon:yes gene_type:complete